MKGLACQNCKKQVEPADAKFFGGDSGSSPHATVFVCTTCHTVATTLHRRGLEELKNIAVLLGENIRLALLRGELTFAAEAPQREVSKKEVLQHIVQMLDPK